MDDDIRQLVGKTVEADKIIQALLTQCPSLANSPEVLTEIAPLLVFPMTVLTYKLPPNLTDQEKLSLAGEVDRVAKEFAVAALIPALRALVERIVRS